MPLDSDVTNGDSQLHVEFYEHKLDPHMGKTFVRIMVPGDKTNIVDRPLRESDKSRFPRQFLHFQMKNASDIVVGTTLEAWREECPEDISDNQLAELRILGFRTAEQLATASDGQLQKVGLGSVGLRERSKAYLTRKSETKNSKELYQTRTELEEMRAQMAAMSEQLNAAGNISLAMKKKPGRPKALVNVKHDDASVGATSHE